MDPQQKPVRRSREEWLEAALELLSREGESKIRVRALAESMDVSTGSFYWHFKSRDDFLRSVVQHWCDRYTTPIIEQTTQLPVDPKSRLHSLVEFIISENLARYDIAVRAWAAHEPIIRPIVAKVDRERFAYLRELFMQIGFRGQQADLCARTFVVYYSMELAIHTGQSKKARLAEAKKRVEMLCTR